MTDPAFEYAPGWGSHQPHIVPAWPVIVKVVWPDKENGWAPAVRIDDRCTRDLSATR